MGRYTVSRKGVDGRKPGEPTKVVRLPLQVAIIARRIAEGTLRLGDLNAFFNVEARDHTTVPLVSPSASCGFPSPADGYLDRALDLTSC